MMSDEWNAGVDAGGTSWGYGFVVIGYWLRKIKAVLLAIQMNEMNLYSLFILNS
jgi:hypothetical protein